MFAFVSDTGRLEILQDELPPGTTPAAAAPGWLDIGTPDPMPQVGDTTVDGHVFVGSHAMSIEATRRAAIEVMSGECARRIAGTFGSAALGAAHTYPADEATQRNMLAAAVVPSTLWCADAAGAWAMAPHTTAQAVQLLADWAAHRAAQQTALAAIADRVAAATTVDAVRAIAWPAA